MCDAFLLVDSFKLDAQSDLDNKTLVVEQQVATVNLLVHDNDCYMFTLPQL